MPNWESFMAEPHSNGMAKMTLAADKSGTIVWIEESSHTGIFGRLLTTFITIQCITAMLRNGKIGPGRAHAISLNESEKNAHHRFGVSSLFSIMVRRGTSIDGVRLPTLIGSFVNARSLLNHCKSPTKVGTLTPVFQQHEDSIDLHAVG